MNKKVKMKRITKFVILFSLFMIRLKKIKFPLENNTNQNLSRHLEFLIIKNCIERIIKKIIIIGKASSIGNMLFSLINIHENKSELMIIKFKRISFIFFIN